MSEKKILQLTKKVISNIEADKNSDLNFNNLAKPQEFLDNNKILGIYNDSFYNIPKSGKKSHRSIINQSYEYMYPNSEKSLESTVEVLVAKLGGLNKDLTQIQLPPPSNMMYPNGTMLQAGSNGKKYDGWHTVWVMDRGTKRKIHGSTNDKLYMEIRKAWRIPGDKWSEIVFLTLPELNKIPDGKDIVHGGHLSIPLSELNEDYGGLYFERSHSILNLYCEGVEVPDSYNVLTGDYYVDDSQGCIIKYIKDEYQGDPIPPTIETIEIDPYKSIELKVLKHEGLPPKYKNNQAIYELYYDGYNDPGNPWSQEAIDAFNEEIGSDVVEYAGNNIYTLSNQPGRKWGRDREYKGIVFASGRIDIKSIDNVNVGTSGDYKKWFLNTKDTTQNIPVSLTFQDVTSHGTRRIYNQCMQVDGTVFEHCYGRLNQSISADPKLIELFDDVAGGKYYLENLRMSYGGYQGDPGFGFNTYNIYNLNEEDKIWNKTYDFYGQPILRGSNGHQWIVLDVDIDKDLVWFFDLTIQSPISIPLYEAQMKFMKVKPEVGDAIPSHWSNDWEPLAIGNNPKDKFFNWEEINSARLSYIGLIESEANGYGDIGNYWNYRTSLHGVMLGNNYYLSVDSQQKIDANHQVQHTIGCDYYESELQNFISSNGTVVGALPDGCHFGNCKNC